MTDNPVASDRDWRRRPPTFAVPETAVRRLALRPVPAPGKNSTPTLYSANRLIVAGVDPSHSSTALDELHGLAARLNMEMSVTLLHSPEFFELRGRFNERVDTTMQSRIDLFAFGDRSEPDAWSFSAGLAKNV